MLSRGSEEEKARIEEQEGNVLTIAILNMFLSNEKKLDPAYTVFEADGVAPKGLPPRATKEILLNIGLLVGPQLVPSSAGA